MVYVVKVNNNSVIGCAYAGEPVQAKPALPWNDPSGNAIVSIPLAKDNARLFRNLDRANMVAGYVNGVVVEVPTLI